MPGPAAPDGLPRLLESLDDADASLRSLYRLLAEDPDLAAEHAPQLAELHARRLDLAQRVGLAMLARSRAERRVDDLPLESSRPEQAAPAPDAPGMAAIPAELEPILEPPPSAPASEPLLARWKSAVRATGLGAGLQSAPSRATAWPLVLHELMATAGPPRNLETSVAVVDEVEALEAVAEDARQELWARLPKNVQQLWLSMLVARGRAVRELPSATPETRERAHRLIVARHAVWSKVHAPGHVNGLQLKHGPTRASWAEDARHHWDALGEVLGEERIEPASGASRRKKPKEAAARDDHEATEIDPSWPLMSLVRGRKALVVGGDPREPNRERLEGAFHLASLDWPDVDGPRKLESVAERIARGSYELIVVLRPFVAHTQSEPLVLAAREAGTPWAFADGYGVAAVKLGLERYLGAPRGAGAGARDEDPVDSATRA